MAFSQTTVGGQTGKAIRLAALAALFLALSLCVWRASSLLTDAGSEPKSPAEASLASLIDPIAGPGNSRISIAFNAEGGRTVFVLLDMPAAPVAGDLQRILPEAAGLDPARGDELLIEQAAFARGLPGRPDTATWLELGTLGLISLISASIALVTLRPQPALAPSRPEAERAIPEARGETLRALRPLAPPTAAEASDVAQKDPARAAEVLRGWMRSREEVS